MKRRCKYTESTKKHTYTPMTTTFEFDNYTVTTSLNERTIYIKFVDALSYMGYETTVDQSEITISVDLEAYARILKSCFMREEGYVCRVSVNSRFMILEINALVGGFLRLNFNVELNEKIMSDDSKLTMSFQRLEQTHLADVKKLTAKIAVLNREITRLSDNSEVMLFNWNALPCYTHIPTYRYMMNPHRCNITKLDMPNNHGHLIDFSKLNRFFQLRVLTVTIGGANNFLEAKSDSLEELAISSTGQLPNCLWLKNFPNLKKINLKSDTTLSTALFSSLQTYEHKLVHIMVVSASAELTAHCVSRNIRLE
jgi:hypothetical protein